MYDERIFERAFQDILERHSGLRTLFIQEDGGVLQREVPPEELHRYKWFWTSPDSAGISRQSEACYRFDLAKELPIRLRFLIDPVTGRQTLSFLFHHIVLDEWSVNLMMDELVHAYRARAAGEIPAWTTAPIPFGKFASQQMTTGVNGTHLDYWTERLRTAPRELKLFDVAAPVPHLSSDASPAGGWVEFKLERHVSDGLYGLAKESGASLFNVVYAAIVTSLHKIGRLTDIVIGTSASGRTDSSFFRHDQLFHHRRRSPFAVSGRHQRRGTDRYREAN
ncbi:condensation domain-containing protein, partial [Rhodomicrobium vannielii]|uniref:condensation domain-containing protein n=1 Tax=Rhodomicrobium vannielii TaxID=1069 RepID=UPI0031BACA2C